MSDHQVPGWLAALMGLTCVAVSAWAIRGILPQAPPPVVPPAPKEASWILYDKIGKPGLVPMAYMFLEQRTGTICLVMGSGFLEPKEPECRRLPTPH